MQSGRVDHFAGNWHPVGRGAAPGNAAFQLRRIQSGGKPRQHRFQSRQIGDMVFQAWLGFVVIAMETGTSAKATTRCRGDIAIAAHHDVERTLARLCRPDQAELAAHCLQR